MINFATPEFNNAVVSFKANFVGHEQLYKYGQFYLTGILTDCIKSTIKQELAQNLRCILSPDLSKEIADPIIKKLDNDPVITIDPGAIDAHLKSKEFNGDLATIRALFPSGKPTKSEEQEIREDFQVVWNSPETGVSAPPFLGGSLTLRKAVAAFSFEKVKCFDVARKMARKYLSKKGITSLKSGLRISVGVVPGARIEEGAAQPGLATQQTLKYDQGQLSKLISLTKLAIDVGAVVQCGVLSGVRQDRGLLKEPEHYVLLFSYGAVDGKEAFLFWDPDAESSVIKTTQWGPGFGCLFYTMGMFSTAIDNTDLALIYRDEASNQFGLHINDETRHCYQVYYIRTWPA